MDPLSLEALQELVETQGKQIETQGKQIEEQGQRIETLEKSLEAFGDLDAKVLSFEKAEKSLGEFVKSVSGKASTSIETKSKKELPKIPEKNVERKGKVYKWNAAAFHLPGGHGLVLAEDAALDNAIIDKILSINGQRILIEQA